MASTPDLEALQLPSIQQVVQVPVTYPEHLFGLARSNGALLGARKLRFQPADATGCSAVSAD
jgi:hypothetical protein